MVSYARAHGFLYETAEVPQALVVTKDRLYLVPATAMTLKKRLGSNIVSPSGDFVLR